MSPGTSTGWPTFRYASGSSGWPGGNARVAPLRCTSRRRRRRRPRGPPPWRCCGRRRRPAASRAPAARRRARARRPRARSGRGTAGWRRRSSPPPAWRRGRPAPPGEPIGAHASWRSGTLIPYRRSASCMTPSAVGADLVAEPARAGVDHHRDAALVETERAPPRRGGTRLHDLHLEEVVAGAERAELRRPRSHAFADTASGSAPGRRPPDSIRSRSSPAPYPCATAHRAPSRAGPRRASLAVSVTPPGRPDAGRDRLGERVDQPVHARAHVRGGEVGARAAARRS